MMRRPSLFRCVPFRCACLLLAFALLPSRAAFAAEPAPSLIPLPAQLQLQPGSFTVGCAGSPMYDVNSETTIKGTVETVETITGGDGRGRRGLGGTHRVAKRRNPGVHCFPLRLG